MAAHKHAEFIKAWADGAVVEVATVNGWQSIGKSPSWNETNYYRIKPAELKRMYPVTSMNADALRAAFNEHMENIVPARLEDVANAALRHACDNGQVVTQKEFQAVVDEAKCATKSLIAAGYAYRGGELWRPPLGNAYAVRQARDMAIANVVYDACLAQLVADGQARLLPALDLPAIIAQVKP
jgi:hypothetical protein